MRSSWMHAHHVDEAALIDGYRSLVDWAAPMPVSPYARLHQCYVITLYQAQEPNKKTQPHLYNFDLGILTSSREGYFICITPITRVSLASASTLSGSVVRTLRGGEGLPKMFCLVTLSLGHLRSQCPVVCGSDLKDIGDLRRGRGDLRRLPAVECGRLGGAQKGPRPLGC